MSGLTLEVVEKAFQQWREQRISLTEPIPNNLREMVVKLYPQHKKTVICRRLGLSGSQLKQHLKASSMASGSGFVLASIDAVNESLMLDTNVQLTIQGKKRTLILSVDVHALDRILPSIGILL